MDGIILIAVVALAAAGGYGLARAMPRRRAESDRAESSRGLRPEKHERAASPEPALGTLRRVDELGDALDRVRRNVGARRVVVWDVDAGAETATPWLASGGAAPKPVPLHGDPLRWAWQEGLPLRLESAPRWASGSVAASAVALTPRGERAALLTLDYRDDRDLPSTAELEDAANYLRAFIRAKQEEERAVENQHHLRQVLDLLQRLPTEIEPDAFAAEFAKTARAVARGTGALTASWDDEKDEGRILSVVGEDGGPEAGTVFQDGGNELGLSVHDGGATIVREDHRSNRRGLPVAARRERWIASPRSFVALPLYGSRDAIAGVLAVWNSAGELIEPRVIGVLEAVAPYAGMQLQQLSAYRNLQKHVQSDAVTGLPNRHAFEDRLKALADQFDRYARPLAMLILDIDHFKAVNDTFGHEAGDAVLHSVAETIRASIRAVDLPFRYGGEEFVILLPETRLKEACDVAERLRASIEAAALTWRGRTIQVRASLGASASPECVEHPTSLLASADAMLYDSKANGRNRVTVAAVR